MGRNGAQPLFEADFQAWDYGPVEPDFVLSFEVFRKKSDTRPNIFGDKARAISTVKAMMNLPFLRRLVIH